MRIFLKKVWSVVELCRTEVTNYDLQGSTRVHHHNPNSKPLEGLPFTVLTAQTLGTDEDALTRVIISRAEKDLKKTTEPYHKRNNESLDQAIAKKTSRDYKAFLLALLGNGGI
ncbi:hypothetical protein DY000_02038257 [Brassica cretica]|uniref:Annexin n=1 Tax=Brassica cretica TaxID=69181 RepID=A0ABQ7BM91_BRACR|nr:hypothetical protein DY000_02038257 [Brassica cretica]